MPTPTSSTTLPAPSLDVVGAALDGTTGLELLSAALGAVLVLVALTVVAVRGLRRRLHPPLAPACLPGVLGGELLVGSTLALVDVRDGGVLTRADVGVLDWLVAHRDPALDATARIVTEVGSPVGTGLLALLGVVVLWRRHDRPGGWLLLGAMAAAATTTWVAKHVAGVPRPPAATQLIAETDASFPSGHVTGTLVLTGVLAVVLGRRTTEPTHRVLLAVLAALAVLVTAAARLYLGVHWASDVGGALLLGGAIVAASAAVSALVAGSTGAVRNPVPAAGPTVR